MTFDFFDEPGPELGSPFNEHHIATLIRALETAWQGLQKARFYTHTHFTSTMYQDEDAITSRLVDLLNRLLKDERCDWFDLGTFQSIRRDAKNASITHGTEKMPDITVSLQKAGRYCPVDNALLIECKVISAGHKSQTVQNYVREGIARFVNKQYSEFATQAMMVAYTAAPFDPNHNLSFYFGKLKTNHADQKCAPCGGLRPFQVDGSPSQGIACQSEHERGDPERIVITHLWLYPNQPV